VSGAAPLPLEVQEAFEKLTRGKLVEGYGLTEASPVTHANPIQGQRKTGTIGVPLPDTDAKIVDLQTGWTPRRFGWRVGRARATGDARLLEPSGGDRARPARRLAVHRRCCARGRRWLFSNHRPQEGYDPCGAVQHIPADVEEVLYENPKCWRWRLPVVPPEGGEQAVKAYVVLKKGEMATAEELSSSAACGWKIMPCRACSSFASNCPRPSSASVQAKIGREKPVNSIQ